jgi:hypothetical protein
MQITGKITKILEAQTGEKKDGSGSWIKQNFLVETEEKYNNLFCFEVFGDEKVQNFQKFNKVGQVVDVEFNVSTNEYKGNYYTSLSAWKIMSGQGDEKYKGKKELTENLGGNLPNDEEENEMPF